MLKMSSWCWQHNPAKVHRNSAEPCANVMPGTQGLKKDPGAWEKGYILSMIRLCKKFAF